MPESLAQTRIEVVVDGIEGALAAQNGGAQRVELCSGLLEGGLTPSSGLITVTRAAVTIGLHVMIRPRSGDFVYTDHEFTVMQRDIAVAKELGADGVVFGILTEEGVIDTRRTATLTAQARPLSVTFHRAFDMVADAPYALECLIDLGIDRVLTSGREVSALEGAEPIAALVNQAAGRIIVMPGGGGTERNLRRILVTTGAREIHLSGRKPVPSIMRYRNPNVHMGAALYPPDYTHLTTAVERIRACRAALLHD